MGTNNSGKSTLMQSIALIQQTLATGTEILKFKEGLLDIGDFDTVIHQNAEEKFIGFRFDLANNTYFKAKIGKKENGDLYVKNFSCNNGKFEYSIGDIIKGELKTSKSKEQPAEYYEAKEFSISSKIYDKYSHLLKELRPSFYRAKFFFNITLFKGEDDIGTLYDDVYKKTKASLSESDEKQFRKALIDMINFYVNLQTVANEFYQNIQGEFNNIKYIGPIRALATRSYQIESHNDVGLTGKYAPQIVADNSDVKSGVEQHFKDLEIADSLQISIDKKQKNFQVKLKTKITDKEVNLVDVGCGTAQILPIIVQSLLKQKESLIVIEQPETHLHPKVQADLAEFFATFASHDKRFLLETHSDYFIERMRYCIMNKKISADDVAIYYVEQDGTEKSSKTTEIKINSKGQYVGDLPDGYLLNFRLKETRKITKKLAENL